MSLKASLSDSESGPRASDVSTLVTEPLGPPVTLATVSCDHLRLFTAVISTIIRLSCPSEKEGCLAPSH